MDERQRRDAIRYLQVTREVRQLLPLQEALDLIREHSKSAKQQDSLVVDATPSQAWARYLMHVRRTTAS